MRVETDAIQALFFREPRNRDSVNKHVDSRLQAEKQRSSEYRETYGFHGILSANISFPQQEVGFDEQKWEFASTHNKTHGMDKVEMRNDALSKHVKCGFLAAKSLIRTYDYKYICYRVHHSYVYAHIHTYLYYIVLCSMILYYISNIL